MDRWEDTWMVDGWVVEKTDVGWMNVWERQVGRWMWEWVEGWMDRSVKGRGYKMDRQIDKKIDGWMRLIHF